MEIQRVAITGSSGYLGRMLVDQCLNRNAKVLGIDIAPSDNSTIGDFRELLLDVRSPDLQRELNNFQPDTVIHGAFIFQPMRNEKEMRDINVGGFKNLLEAMATVQPKRFHVVSSATAYGAGKNHALPRDENSPMHRSTFQYAADKFDIERLRKTFEQQHPEITVSCSRPCLIGGPKIDNYFSRFLFGMPVMILPGGSDTPLQFVHEKDVTDAIMKIVEASARGAFNIGPGDSSSLSMIASKSGRRAIKLPFWFCHAVHWLAWNCHVPIHESPPTLLEFARYPWLVDSARLTEELGFQFQYSSDQTLDIMIDHLQR